MEETFGEDFGNVTAVFGGGPDGLPANAATDGRFVWFHEENPSREQVAHELTHVVQNKKGSGTGTSKPGDSSEREAEDTAKKAAAGESVQVDGAASGDIQANWMADAGAWLSTAGHDIAQGVGIEDEFDANLGRADAFHGHGDYGPQQVVSGTGIGGFEAFYHPGSNTFDVTLRVAVNFVDGLKVDSSGAINPAHANLQTIATQAAALAEPERSAFIAQYQWAAGDSGRSTLVQDMASVSGSSTSRLESSCASRSSSRSSSRSAAVAPRTTPRPQTTPGAPAPTS